MFYATKINYVPPGPYSYSPSRPFYPGYQLPQRIPGNYLQRGRAVALPPRPVDYSAVRVDRQPPTRVGLRDEPAKKGSWSKLVAAVAVLVAVLLIIAVIVLAVKLSQDSSTDSQAGVTTPIPLTAAQLNGSMTLGNWIYSPDLSNPRSTLFVTTSLTFCKQIEFLLSNSTVYTNGGCVVNAFGNGSVIVDYTVQFMVRTDQNENTLRRQLASTIAAGVSNGQMNSGVMSGYFTDDNGNKVDNCIGNNGCQLYKNSACFTTLESFVCFCLPGYVQSAPNTDCFVEASTSNPSDTASSTSPPANNSQQSSSTTLTSTSSSTTPDQMQPSMVSTMAETTPTTPYSLTSSSTTTTTTGTTRPTTTPTTLSSSSTTTTTIGTTRPTTKKKKVPTATLR